MYIYEFVIVTECTDTHTLCILGKIEITTQRTANAKERVVYATKKLRRLLYRHVLSHAIHMHILIHIFYTYIVFAQCSCKRHQPTPPPHIHITTCTCEYLFHTHVIFMCNVISLALDAPHKWIQWFAHNASWKSHNLAHHRFHACRHFHNHLMPLSSSPTPPRWLFVRW